MPTFEIKAKVAPGSVDSVAGQLAAAEETRWLVQEDRRHRRAWIIGFFDLRADAIAAWRQLAALIGTAWAKGNPTVRALADDDWQASYRAHFRPWHIGRMHWAPVWRRRNYRVRRTDRVVWLDPGMAFGTGDHATTRLCCERLVAFAARVPASRRPDGEQWTVIDAGCGSGILAISAARLGASAVFAFDTDAAAVRISRANARLNGVSRRVKFATADLGSGLAGRRARLVLANIQADVLVQHRRQLAAAVLPGGWLSLSGILQREVAEVRSAYAEISGHWVVKSRRMGEWADLLLMRAQG